MKNLMLRLLCAALVVVTFALEQTACAQLITAHVEVVGSLGEFVPLELGTPYDSLNTRHSWGELPETLIQEPQLHSWQMASGSGNVAGGIISFDVLTDGPALLAVTTRWGGGGNSSGDWIPELTTEAEFLADGWVEYASPMLVYTNGFDGATHQFTTYRRDSLAGESFTYRTEKYVPPLPLTTQFTAATDGAVQWSIEDGGNGHFYDYVEGDFTWSEARDMAASMVHDGLHGYLTTITSEEENNFIADNLFHMGFLGGSDAEVEGDWKWVVGPETGQLFFRGEYPDPDRETLIYADWGGNEPNDFDNTPFDFPYAGEDFLVFVTRGDGEWNDIPGDPYTSGFHVEFSTSYIAPIALEAGMYEALAGESFIVQVIAETDKNLTSLNPAISLNPVVGIGSAVITDDSGTAGGFWGGQPTTVSDVLNPGQTAGKFNVSLDNADDSATGTGEVVSFEVTVPPDANVGDKWSIDFLTGPTGSTWSQLGGSTAETEFSSLTSGMVFIVPEPSAVGMFLVGMLVIVRRRKRKV